MNPQDHKQALPPDFRLGNYRVVRVLGAGGFGVTYLCKHGGLGVMVAVKEYLPNDIAVRSGNAVAPKSTADREGYQWGLSRFLDEARTLARFEHRNVVRVRDYFEANGTAYIVMDYEDGEPLDSVLERKGTLTEAQIKRLLFPIVAGLRQMHAAGFLHRDVKPANVFIRRSDESPVLLDFGSARQALGRLSRSVTAIASSGYSPPEQYESGGEQGPWTDIYALSALCYRTITGMAPVEATRRQSRLLRDEDDPLPRLAEIARGRCSPAFLAAVDRGLRVVEGERQGSLDEWCAELEGRTIGQPTSHLVPPNARSVVSKAIHEDPKWAPKSRAEWPAEPRHRSRTVWLLVGVAVTAIVAAFVYFATFERNASYGEGAEHDPDAKSWFTQALNRYLLRTAAELGDADAQFELALLYNHGEGVTEDQQQAMLWYRKAAEQGLADAQLRLGRMLASGAGAADDYEVNLWLHQTDAMDIVRDWGAADDDEEAVMWVRKAAAQGLACAQVYLGQAYMVGVEGVLEQDSQQALLWQRRAAEQGLAFAQWQLGYQYGRGSHGVAKDYQQAALWYRKAAEQGLALAQNSLGLLYMRGSFEADSDGRSVAEDDQQQAMLWYRKAAEQGYAFAQYNLGEMYYTGEGVGVKAYPQAALWYRRAAEQGHPGAQFWLGAMYADGLGLPKDAVKSYAWASVAAAQGNIIIESSAGQVRDRIGEAMTPSQIAAAQRLGRELAAEIEAAKPIRPTIGGSCG